MPTKKALIIAPSSAFPQENASGVRQYHTAKLLQELNYDVCVFGVSTTSNQSQGKYDSISYTSPANRYFDIKKKVQEYLFSLKYFPELMIITEGMPVQAFTFLRRYAKKHNIPIYCDCVEWFSISQSFSKKRIINPGMFILYLNIQILNRIIITHQFNVLSISSYLESYFQKRNIETYRLPIVMDVVNHKYEKTISEPMLKIVYAGSPSSKDYIKELIVAITLLNDKELEKIEFTLLGVSQAELISLCHLPTEEMSRIADSLQPMGRVPRDTVLEHLKSADFSVIIRSSTARYAKAGFPTKSVEALMSGTPLFLNMTSDLGMYLKDGYDCIEVENETPEAIAVALRRALALTPEEKDQMKKNARKTAEDNFDYRLYIESFGQFIQNAK